jgi:hypothetical protein
LKIEKRNLADPKSTAVLWIIPTWTYITEKALGAILPGREWIWWVTIPSLVLAWFLFNFKIKK